MPPVDLNPPRTIDELLARARALDGLTVGELARRLGRRPARDAVRGKGQAGELVELALGANAGNQDEPDFQNLGVELKTIPLDRAGHVRESTYVCYLDLETVQSEEWERSRVRRKLQRVLWIPVEWTPGGPPADRHLGTARLWTPTEEQEATLRADWLQLVGRIAVGGIEEISAHMGQVLQIRPKAPNAAARVEALGPEGEIILTVPRGFYLRARFTEAVLWGAGEARS
jgi:DNA mismatch repair protein MutH